MAGRDPVAALAKKDGVATRKMKKTLAEATPSQAASELTPAQRAAETRAQNREVAKKQKTQDKFWDDATKILVPAYWGNNGVEKGLELAKSLSPAGVLALILVGIRTDKGPAKEGDRGSCEVSMQMRLRPSGFDRQEACEMAERGFADIRALGLLKRTALARSEFRYESYLLSAKGMKAYGIIRRSATGVAD